MTIGEKNVFQEQVLSFFRKNSCFPLVITCSFFLFLVSAFSAKAEDRQSTIDLVKYYTPAGDIFFVSLLSKLNQFAGLDYVSTEKPFNRAMWELAQNKGHVAGPFPLGTLVDYATTNHLPIEKLMRIPTVVDRKPMFGLYLRDRNIQKEIKTQKRLRFAIMRGDHYTLTTSRHQLLSAKSLDQVVNLLKVGRVDFAFLSKKDLDTTIRNNPDAKLRWTHRPFYYQDSFLFINRDKHFLADKLTQALEKLTKTNFYHARWERYSHESEWQSD